MHLLPDMDIKANHIITAVLRLKKTHGIAIVHGCILKLTHQPVNVKQLP
jgi:hypothetical protein